MHTGRFDGKVVLITGAASGIGLATARLISGEGGLVALVDRDADALEKAAAEIEGSLAIEADISDPEQVAEAFETTVSKLGGPSSTPLPTPSPRGR